MRYTHARTILPLLALLATFFAFGCAEAKLSVQVDVYEEDPFLASFVDDVPVLRDALRDARTSLDDMANARMRLAADAVRVTRGYYNVMAEANRFAGAELNVNEAIRPVTDARDDYADAIRNRRADIVTRLDAADAALRQFESLARARNEATTANDPTLAIIDARDRLLDMMDHIRNDLVAFASPWGSDFESLLNALAEAAPDDLQAVLTAFDDASPPEIMNAVTGLQNDLATMAELQKKLRTQGFTIDNALADAATGLDRAIRENDRTRVMANVTEAMRIAMESGDGPGMNAAGRESLRTLGMSLSFYESQLHRLQDPADPAWRVITDPDNAHKWRPFLSRAEYSAEGNASVVLVQDRVGRFRVQRGKNNPAALIQGQYRINRAIASGVVDLLAAVAGVGGVPGLPTLPSDPPPPHLDLDIDGDAIAADARAAARADADDRLRRALLNELKTIRAEIAATPQGRPVDPAHRERLHAVLQAYAQILNAEGDNG